MIASHRHLSRRVAFTLIELIIVVAVIAILASLILAVTGGLGKKRMLNVAKVELEQMETAIESYKAKTGFYPPDNGTNSIINPLYFELAGTIYDSANAVYVTLDGSARISETEIGTVYGPNVSGFMNSSKSSSGDDENARAKNFIKGLKSRQIGEYSTALPNVKLLGCSVRWPLSAPNTPVPGNVEFNPWRYNSSSPTNNPHSYDLWVDLVIRDTTNRIYRVSNWSKQPQVIE